MRQSGLAVRLSAVLAIVGSVLTLLFAIVMCGTAFFAPPPREGTLSPAAFKGMMLFTAALFLGLSGWGISTAIGIFLRRRWSRISMLVFAALLTMMSAVGL